jgi:phage terminase small subunit
MGRALARQKADAQPLRLLNDREYRFVFEYVVDYNGSNAAIAAGYSKKTAAVQAAKLLRKPKIKDALKYLTKKTVRKAEVDAEEAMRQLYFALTRHPKMFFDDTGTLLPPDQLPEEVGSLVDGFKIKTNTYTDEYGEEHTKTEIEYKITPHATARDQALKVLGMMTEKKELVATVGFKWDDLYGEDSEKDIIEATIAEEEEEGQ